MISDEIYSHFLYLIVPREEPIPENLISIDHELTVLPQCNIALVMIFAIVFGNNFIIYLSSLKSGGNSKKKEKE